MMIRHLPRHVVTLLPVLPMLLAGWNLSAQAAAASSPGSRIATHIHLSKPKAKPPVPKGPAGGCLATKQDNAPVPATIGGEAGAAVETLRGWVRGDLDSYRSWLGDMPLSFSAVCVVWPLQAAAPSGPGAYYSAQVQPVPKSKAAHCVITVNPARLMGLDPASRK